MARTRTDSAALAHVREGMEAARQGIDQLNAAERELRDAHHQKRLERDEVASALEPTDVIVANMRACIDEASSRVCGEYLHTVRAAFSYTLEEQASGTLQVRRPALPTLTHDARLTLEQLAAFAPDLLKARFESIIRSIDEPSPGRIQVREAQLAAIDAELHEIEAQHTALVDMAATLDPPIVLQLLEPVRRRRETERRRAEGLISDAGFRL